MNTLCPTYACTNLVGFNSAAYPHEVKKALQSNTEKQK